MTPRPPTPRGWQVAVRLLQLLLMGLGLLERLTPACRGASAPGASSGSHSVLHHGLDTGGGRHTSALYRIDGSFGLFGSVSTSSGATARTGFVGQLNEPPNPLPDVVERLPGSAVRISVAKLLANDTDLEGDPPTLVLVTSPTLNGATVTRVGDQIEYVPPPGFLGTDSFSYIVSDPHGQLETGTVSVVVVGDPGAITRNIVAVITLANGNVRVSFAGVPGRSYAVETSASLTPPAWVRLTTVTADANGRFEVVDPVNPGAAQRFYRAVLP